jgi:hypothetical protein
MSESFLLAAFPARLRRRHGPELIATMAEVSGPTGPTRADRWHLMADGLRERFRLPPRQPLAVVAAVLTLLIGGALGAVAGSWVGMWTFPKMPAAGPIVSQALGSDAAPPTVYPNGLWMDSMSTLNPGLDPTKAAGDAHDRLAAAGWKPTSVQVSGGTDGIHFRRAEFRAEKSGTGLEVTAYYGDDSLVDVHGWSLQPATYVPLVLIGTVLGLLAGWLAGAALSYRIAGARRRRSSAVLAGAGLALLLIPTSWIYKYVIEYLPAHVHNGLPVFVHRAMGDSPISDLLFRINFGSLTTDSWRDKNLVIAGLAATALAAIVARPGRVEQEPAQVA